MIIMMMMIGAMIKTTMMMMMKHRNALHVHWSRDNSGHLVVFLWSSWSTSFDAMVVGMMTMMMRSRVLMVIYTTMSAFASVNLRFHVLSVYFDFHNHCPKPNWLFLTLPQGVF